MAHALEQTPSPGRRTGVLTGVGILLGLVLFSLVQYEPAAQDLSWVVEIEPGDNIQAQIDLFPPGTTFRLKAGTHRLTRALIPKDGDSFLGEPGAILSGARVLSPVWSGTYWVANGQTQQGRVHGVCRPSSPRCGHPEELYVDDLALAHVANPTELGPGRWHFDYGNDRILGYGDPTGHRVETSVATQAFGGSAANVTIANLTIEKFANAAQSGAVHADATRGWTLRDNTIRLNHGVGVRTGSEMQVLRNLVVRNGQLGIGGGGTAVLLQGNEIAFNNTTGFESGWEAGGAKMVNTRGLVIRDNFVHHNDGYGLWTDIDNIDTLYEGNRVEDNSGSGIFHEISYKAVIRRNTVKRNGFAFSAWLWGAGILVAASPDVEVYENVVLDNADGIAAIQQSRGSGRYGPYEIWSLWVHDNIIGMTTGQTGLVQDVGDRSYFSSRNNRFDRNSYYTGSGGRYFGWLDGDRTAAEWRSFNNDVNGTFATEPAGPR
jgi:hypothetical protein